jgi:hypothetical protein
MTLQAPVLTSALISPQRPPKARDGGRIGVSAAGYIPLDLTGATPLDFIADGTSNTQQPLC